MGFWIPALFVLFFTGFGALAMSESPSNLDFMSTALRTEVLQSVRQKAREFRPRIGNKIGGLWTRRPARANRTGGALLKI